MEPTEQWQSQPGVVQFPSGRKVRGRSWRKPSEDHTALRLVLTTVVGSRFGNPGVTSNADETITIDWPDYRLPRRPAQALEILRNAYDRAAHERVEITCKGGVGRTGTALAILAVMDGMEPQAAIDFIKEVYDPGSIENPAQRAFIRDLVVDQSSSGDDDASGEPGAEGESNASAEDDAI